MKGHSEEWPCFLPVANSVANPVTYMSACIPFPARLLRVAAGADFPAVFGAFDLLRPFASDLLRPCCHASSFDPAS